MAERCSLFVFHRASDARAYNPTPAEGRPDFACLPFSLGHPNRPPPPAHLLRSTFPEYPLAYERVLQGIDYLVGVEGGIDVLNLSLGPSGNRFDPEEPLQIATRFVHDQGIPVVVAAGNNGPANGTLQPLALAPWTIAVGATDLRGEKLLESSSRGLPGSRGPTVVASGYSEIVIVGGREFGPGTSFATGHVARLTPWVKKCLELLLGNLRDARDGHWTPTSQPIPLSTFAIADTGLDPRAIDPLPPEVQAVLAAGKNAVELNRDERERQWLTRVIHEFDRHGLSAPREAGPALVERALRLIAQPMPAYQPHEVGSGFVARGGVHGFFASLTPSKFAALLCPETTAVARKPVEERLDGELGPLWNGSAVEAAMTYFYHGQQFAVARVA